MITNRDVTFDERGVWDWTNKDPKNIELTLNFDGEDKDINFQLVPAIEGSYTELTGCPHHHRQLPARLQDYVITYDNASLIKKLLILLSLQIVIQLFMKM